MDTEVSSRPSGHDLLHGTLEVTVLKLEGLPAQDGPFSLMPMWLAQRLTPLLACRGCICRPLLSDPFIELRIGQGRLFKTQTRWNKRHVRFDETFTTYVCHRADTGVTLVCKDRGVLNTPSIMGRVVFSADEVRRAGTEGGAVNLDAAESLRKLSS